jgi:glycerophosphoryl diester phosphodiesterase
LTVFNAPPWLTARPIAHRGLHDTTRGVVENSSGAVSAAIVENYAIECDVQCTKDGEAIVFHDFTLDRLTSVKGDIGAFTADEVTRLAYRDGTGMVATLSDFLTAVDGRVPLFIEIKSRFDADMRLAARVASLATAYSGPVALQSFDPKVVAECRTLGVECPLGLVAQAAYDAATWPELPQERRERLGTLIDFPAMRPDFLAWRAADLPHDVPLICRVSFDMPVLAWTLRDAQSAATALRWADQIIFEGFDPEIDGR